MLTWKNNATCLNVVHVTNFGKMSTKRFPKGWSLDVVFRKGGASRGKFDIYVYSPGKQKKFRSFKELKSYITSNDLPWKLEDFSDDLFSRNQHVANGQDLSTSKGLKSNTAMTPPRKPGTKKKDFKENTTGNCLENGVQAEDISNSKEKENTINGKAEEKRSPQKRKIPEINSPIAAKQQKLVSSGGKPRKNSSVTSANSKRSNISPTKKIDQSLAGSNTDDITIISNSEKSRDVGLNCAIISSPLFESSTKTVQPIERKFVFRRSNEKWELPKSPYLLLQENFCHDPWKLLVSTMILEMLNDKASEKLAEQFFQLWPSPELLDHDSVESLVGLLKQFNLNYRNAQKIKKFTSDYLTKEWSNPVELHGVTKFGEDSYHIFCKSEWMNVQPDNEALQCYQNWLSVNSIIID